MSIVEGNGRTGRTPFNHDFHVARQSRDYAESLRQEGAALFLISSSAAPCGVESFARRTARHWRQIGLNGQSLGIDGRLSDLHAIWRGLDDCEALVLNFPVVAWKKVIFTPFFAFLIALLRGRKTIMVQHEWDDLDWRRRAVVGFYAVFAKSIIFSSPMVRDQFLGSPLAKWLKAEISLTTIPANLDRAAAATPPDIALRVRKIRESGKLILVHFGSIYPKKQSDFVLDVMIEMKRAGKDVAGVFVGGFVKGSDDGEARFMEKIGALGLENNVLITGYVEREEDVFALFEEADCFIYRFADGLSSRRSSVLASLQSGRPVIVNAPDEADEFAHHRIFRTMLESGVLHLVGRDANASEYASAVIASAENRHFVDDALFHQAWRDAVRTIAIAADPALDNSVVFSERRRKPRFAIA